MLWITPSGTGRANVQPHGDEDRTGCDTGDEQRHLPATAWLFQIQPARYRIFDAVADGFAVDGLSARQHRSEINVGDGAVLWLSRSASYPAGVYAIGRVTSTFFDDRADGYWTDPPAPDTFVEVQMDRNVFHHPVSKDLLAHDPDFTTARILSMPRETSQVLTTPEWSAIERHVMRHRPTARPTLSASS